jgi:hypothetical protein
MTEIIREIYSQDRMYRVLIVKRKNGLFGYEEEYFSQDPMERCWCPYSQKPFAICDSPETALKEAKGRIKWLSLVDVKDEESEPLQPRLQDETICPGCLARYLPNTILVEYPFCPDCSSEAMDIDVVSYREFVDAHPLAEFEEMKRQWDVREGLVPKFKELVSKRINELIREKG